MALFRCFQFGVNRTFVIDVPSRTRIKEARAIINGTETRKVHVIGTIVKKPTPYNRPWSWHLDPPTIEFFELAKEVCDASVVEVESNLGDVGGAFLPKNLWCPWKSLVIEEIEDGPSGKRRKSAPRGSSKKRTKSKPKRRR